jgi:A/G-specific adenine glycosylase
MAAALAEFASGKRAIVIDTNIRRVMGRVIGILFPTPQDDEKIRRALERETPLTKGHVEFPQALMDLANAVCAVRRPACSICPLQKDCRSAKKFLRGDVIRPTRRGPTERMHGEKPHPDRIYRGRILAWIRLHGTTRVIALGPHIDPTYDPIIDQEWIEAMVERLIKDGLLIKHAKERVSLP